MCWVKWAKCRRQTRRSLTINYTSLCVVLCVAAIHFVRKETARHKLFIALDFFIVFFVQTYNMQRLNDQFAGKAAICLCLLSKWRDVVARRSRHSYTHGDIPRMWWIKGKTTRFKQFNLGKCSPRFEFDGVGRRMFWIVCWTFDVNALKCGRPNIFIPNDRFQCVLWRSNCMLCLCRLRALEIQIF